MFPDIDTLWQDAVATLDQTRDVGLQGDTDLPNVICESVVEICEPVKHSSV